MSLPGDQYPQQPPAFPGMPQNMHGANTPNPVGGHDAQRLAEAAVEHARMISAAQRYAELTAPQAQQRAMPVHAPASAQPHAMPMQPEAAPQPLQQAPKQPKAPRAPAAAEHGTSMWTILIALAIGTAVGFACDRHVVQLAQHSH